jgi:glycosyltransferase involved in cell wall biosynthesis
VSGSSTAPADPRVSVVLTTCDSEAYLAPQLASVVGQRRPVDEIVVGDDASTDDTRSILTRLLPHDPSVTLHVVERDRRVGFRANVESTAQLATGDVICFADHDDVWRDDKVERILAALDGRTRAAVFTNGRIINAPGNVQRTDLWGRAGFDHADRRAMRAGDALRVLLEKRVVTGAALACTRDLLDVALPVPDSAVHDHWIALVAATCGELIPLDEPLIDYRVHDANAIGLSTRNPLHELRRRLDAGDVAGREVEILSALMTRVGDDLRPDDRARIERAIDHHEFRTHLPASAVSRSVAATRELVRGGYGRYHPSATRSWLYDLVRTPTDGNPHL